MKLIYMGTPAFAVPPLRALIRAGHEVCGVVTRTDKPKGRGRAITPPPVKDAALELGLPILQPARVRDPAVIEELRKRAPDVIVVAAYGQILPSTILTMPRHGCVNIHASLLPAYRGAAPINWAIIRGEKEAGITIMQMDAGMDTGAILMQESLPVTAEDTAGSLTDKMAELGARLIVQALPLIADGTLRPQPQDNTRATLAPLLRKADGLIDWSLPAIAIRDRIRGLSPWPGAYGLIDGKAFKVLSAEAAEGRGEPGSVEVQGDVLTVGTGNGMLRITTIQPEGKKPMAAAEFLRGHRDLQGKKFEARISNS